MHKDLHDNKAIPKEQLEEVMGGETTPIMDERYIGREKYSDLYPDLPSSKHYPYRDSSSMQYTFPAARPFGDERQIEMELRRRDFAKIKE